MKSTKEKDDAFEARFIELARMTRQRSGAGKNHRPRHIRWPSPKFRLDEIGDAAKKEPDRNRGGANIDDAQDRYPLALGKKINRNSGPGEAAVKRHAAFPDSEDLGGMGEIKAGIVEKDIAEPAAENDAQRHIDEQIVDVHGVERRGGRPTGLFRPTKART